MNVHKENITNKYDTSIIRTQIGIKDFQLRGQEMPLARLKGIKKGLLTLHNLQLITAMCNEMTHYQDYEVKFFEYGWKPSKLRWLYWIVGFIFGFSSRLIGSKAILKTGIWVETKAVHHYDELLKTIDWDEDTRKVVEKNQSDEYGHASRWKMLLQSDKA